MKYKCGPTHKLKDKKKYMEAQFFSPVLKQLSGGHINIKGAASQVPLQVFADTTSFFSNVSSYFLLVSDRRWQKKMLITFGLYKLNIKAPWTEKITLKHYSAVQEQST